MNATEAARVSLYIPAELKSRVQETAQANHRSLTREIEHTLTTVYVAKPSEPEPSR